MDKEKRDIQTTEQVFTICADKHLRMRIRSGELDDTMNLEEDLAADALATRSAEARTSRLHAHSRTRPIVPIIHGPTTQPAVTAP